MPRIQLQNLDGRIVYVATVYHLGRPGAETDAVTLQRHDLGLGPVREALEPQIKQAVITVELSEYQLSRLGQALLGVINELKQYEMAAGRSAVPGFSEAVQRLFPEVRDESGAALDLVQHTVMLHRRLGAAIRDAEAAVRAAREEEEQGQRKRERERRSWWKVWQR